MVKKVVNTHREHECPFCGSLSCQDVGEISYGERPVFGSHEIELTERPYLRRCKSCRSGFVQNTISQQKQMELYSDSDPGKRWSIAEYKQEKTKALVDFVYTHAFGARSVLDVGASDGVLLDYLSSFVCNTYGVEVSHDARNEASSKGHRMYSTFEEIPKEERFDVIFLMDIIEHLYATEKVFEGCLAKLSEQGRIICLTGNINCVSAKLSGSRWWYLSYPEHIRFPSLKYLAALPGIRLESVRKVYNSKGYQAPMVKRIKAVAKGMLNRSYNGLPAAMPDHYVVSLRAM